MCAGSRLKIRALSIDPVLWRQLSKGGKNSPREGKKRPSFDDAQPSAYNRDMNRAVRVVRPQGTAQRAFERQQLVRPLATGASNTSPASTPRESNDVFDRLERCQALLTAKELARMLAVSPKTIYSYVSRNMIPYYKIEANVRFRAQDIADWLRRHAA